MKRLAAILALALAAALVTSVPAAEAGGRSYKCDSKSWHTYVGLESPVLHLRWGDLKAHMRVCWRTSNGQIIHSKTRAGMQVIPNGTSETWGTDWTVYGSHQDSYADGLHQNYQDKRYMMGTFRNCQGIGSARICGPTGHFTVVLTYTHDRLRAWEPGVHPKWNQYRRAGEPNKAADNFDRKIRFYDSP